MTEITQLLLAWRDGDRSALEQLAPLVYGELRRLARRQLGRDRGLTLQATAVLTRGLPEAHRSTFRQLAESHALLCHRRATDAAHRAGTGPRQTRSQACITGAFHVSTDSAGITTAVSTGRSVFFKPIGSIQGDRVDDRPVHLGLRAGSNAADSRARGTRSIARWLRPHIVNVQR